MDSILEELPKDFDSFIVLIESHLPHITLIDLLFSSPTNGFFYNWMLIM